jgi:hypothetical protein
MWAQKYYGGSRPPFGESFVVLLPSQVGQGIAFISVIGWESLMEPMKAGGVFACFDHFFVRVGPARGSFAWGGVLCGCLDACLKTLQLESAQDAQK